MADMFNPATPAGEERVTTDPWYRAAFFTVVSLLNFGLFVLNVCTNGTMLGLIGTGGLAVLMGVNAYRVWFGKRPHKPAKDLQRNTDPKL